MPQQLRIISPRLGTVPERLTNLKQKTQKDQTVCSYIPEHAQKYF